MNQHEYAVITLSVFQALLDLGASPNSRDENGLTPLYHCVSNNDEFDADCVEMLLWDYAQHGIVDAAGSTELHQVRTLRHGL
jgi:Ankyrin repeats (many copies)